MPYSQLQQASAFPEFSSQFSQPFPVPRVDELPNIVPQRPDIFEGGMSHAEVLNCNPTSGIFAELFRNICFEGLSLGDIQHGEITATIPLVAGKHRIYTWSGVYAKLKIPENTEMNVRLNIQQNESGEPELRELRMSLSKPILCKNPCQAFIRTKGVLGIVVDAFKDRPFDVLVDGAYLEPESGLVRIEGQVKFPWPFEAVDMKSFVQEKMLPKLKLGLKDWLEGKALDRMPDIRILDPQWTERSLETVINLFKTSQMSIHLNTSEVKPRMTAEGITLQPSNKANINTDIRASITPQPNKTLLVDLTRELGNGVTVDVGPLSFGINGSISCHGKEKTVTGSIQLDSDPQSLEAVIQRKGRSHTLHLNGPQHLHLDTKFRVGKEATILRDGNAQVELHSTLPQCIGLEVPRAFIGAENAEIHLKGEIPFYYDGHTVHTHAPRLDIGIQAGHVGLRKYPAPRVLQSITEQKYYVL